MTVVCICMGSRGKQLKVRACEMGTLSSCVLFLAEKQERFSGVVWECLLVLAWNALVATVILLSKTD